MIVLLIVSSFLSKGLYDVQLNLAQGLKSSQASESALVVALEAVLGPDVQRLGKRILSER